MENFIKYLEQEHDILLIKGSHHSCQAVDVAVVNTGDGDFLVVQGTGEKDFYGAKRRFSGHPLLTCELSVANAQALMHYFPYLKPSSIPEQSLSFGFGDRLGRATLGHLKAVMQFEVFPVLAQQSMRELSLTNRTYDDVLSSAVFDVLKAGYMDGFAADGDHLKTIPQIELAIDAGFNMITLDCSEHIHNQATDYSESELEAHFSALASETKDHYLANYLNREIPSLGIIDKVELFRTVLTFHEAIMHAIQCYKFIMSRDRKIHFELSMDETPHTTSPIAHFIIVNELLKNDVNLFSFAPRFHGQFEKGIDYIGHIDTFARTFEQHQQIVNHFDSYKLSVHSGSDKFSVMPIIGKIAGGSFHIKTAGTSWLEAVRLVAIKDPNLYRKMHEIALSRIDKARMYYNVSLDMERIPPIKLMNDAYLPNYMNLPDARQALHITYGLILETESVHRAFFELLDHEITFYSELLKAHLSQHMRFLGAHSRT